MSTHPSQTEALERLADFQRYLDTAPNSDRLAPLILEAGELRRSIESFHMEAIRFRYYGLRRRLRAFDTPLPPAALERLDGVGRSLSAAGFKVE